MIIQIEPKNLQNYEDPFQIEVEGSHSVMEVFETYKSILIEEGEEVPEFKQVIIYLERKPTQKLTPMMKISEITQSNHDKFVIIFPESNLPIIQFTIGDACYYKSDYKKTDLLSRILSQTQEPVKSIIVNGEYNQITINGKLINLAVQKDTEFKKYLENYMNSIININIKPKIVKGPKSIEKQESKKQEPKIEKVQSKKEEQKMQKVESKKEVPTRAKKPSQNKQLLEPNKSPFEGKKVNEEDKPKQIKREVKIQQNLLQNIAIQNQPLQILPKKQTDKTKDIIHLIIKFQAVHGANSKQELTFPVDSSNSMLNVLPQILIALKMNGFDWTEKDYIQQRDCDKINITFDYTQFKKLDKPFRQLIDVTNQKKVVFTFERHYQGGGLAHL